MSGRPGHCGPVSRTVHSVFWKLPRQEIPHQRCDFVALVFEREMSGVEQMQLGVRDITQIRACTGGREHEVDCTRLGAGYGCRELDGAYFCGLGSECVPGETTHGVSGSGAFCEGTTVVFCKEGLWERMDCQDLGFEGCSEAPGSLRGCTPNFLTMWE